MKQQQEKESQVEIEVLILKRQLQEKEAQLAMQWRHCSEGSQPNHMYCTSKISGSNFRLRHWPRGAQYLFKIMANSCIYVIIVQLRIKQS